MTDDASETPRGTRTLCRDCDHLSDRVSPTGRCLNCNGPRLVHHTELDDLALAHIDCDAFYASIEKRDAPSLAGLPVIVGGGRRGVVAACCYQARRYGIHSAMPMFKALERCPDAVVLRPDMTKYQREGRKVRDLMTALTPLVEPLSIDEAFIDLTGTERLHGLAPAQTLTRLARRIEAEVGITVSIGLADCKFLAKIASDLDKPRGFAVVGRTNLAEWLATHPVGIIPGVGRRLQDRLRRDGIETIGQLQGLSEKRLLERHGTMGALLFRLARGLDDRPVRPDRPVKSVSNETTFDVDHHRLDDLSPILWRLSDSVARRLKAKDLAGRTVTLKLKTSRFQTRSRSRTLPAPTQIADVIFRHGLELLTPECDGTPFRLIGIGVQDLTEGIHADPPDLADWTSQRTVAVDRAIDDIRARLGDRAITRGRGLGPGARRR